MYSCTDVFLTPDFKVLSTVETVPSHQRYQQDMLALGQFSIPKNIVVHEDRKLRPKIHCKTKCNFFSPPPKRKDLVLTLLLGLPTNPFHAAAVAKVV